MVYDMILVGMRSRYKIKTQKISLFSNMTVKVHSLSFVQGAAYKNV